MRFWLKSLAWHAAAVCGSSPSTKLVCSLSGRGGDGLKAAGAWGSGAAAALALGPAPPLDKAAISGSLAAIDALPPSSAEAELLIPAVPGLSEPLVPAEAQAEAPTEDKKKVRSPASERGRCYLRFCCRNSGPSAGSPREPCRMPDAIPSAALTGSNLHRRRRRGRSMSRLPATMRCCRSRSRGPLTRVYDRALVPGAVPVRRCPNQAAVHQSKSSGSVCWVCLIRPGEAMPELDGM